MCEKKKLQITLKAHYARTKMYGYGTHTIYCVKRTRRQTFERENFGFIVSFKNIRTYTNYAEMI